MPPPCVLALLSGKKRKPAWTDRILWRMKPKASPAAEVEERDGKEAGGSEKKQQQALAEGDDDEEYPFKVKQDLYTSNMEYGVSDHKPVFSIFHLEVRHLCNLTDE